MEYTKVSGILIPQTKFDEMYGAISIALRIEKAALKDLEISYGVYDSGNPQDDKWAQEDMEKSAEWAAITSNIKCYEKALE